MSSADDLGWSEWSDAARSHSVQSNATAVPVSAIVLCARSLSISEPARSLAMRPFNDALSSLFRMGIALDRGDVVDMVPLQREFQITQVRFEDYVRSAASARL